jgi:hypothetical protein
MNYRAFSRNTLVGFFDVCIDAEMIIAGLSLHVKGDGRWVSWPSRKVPAKGDQPESWQPIVKFIDRDVANVWRGRILDALDRDEQERRSGGTQPQPKAEAKPYELHDDLPF